MIGAAGLVIGLFWPKLTGMRLGPEVPGQGPPVLAASAPMTPLPAPTAAPSLLASAEADAAVPASPDGGDDLHQQLVVVTEPTIERCWRGKDMAEGAECGPLRVDPVLVPRLRELARCPSALGLAGKLQLGFDIDFEKNQIRVLRGDKGEVPASTVQGVLTCLADYVGDITPEKIRHNYPKYRVLYTLTFYPPGARPATAPADPAAAAEESADDRGVATVAWDTALMRDEPKTGKVVARLVRGTRVTILSRRQEWYRVRVRNNEGWVYRGALGM